MVVEIEAMGHRAICEGCHDSWDPPAETKYRAFGTASAFFRKFDYASHSRLHATCGQNYTYRVKHALFCRIYGWRR
jgi:hypothetical protein